MDPKIQNLLAQGIVAHKEGNFADAERFYRAILLSAPEHPAANHHLGMIAVSLNKPGLAIPYFKIALEAAPEDEQCWVSLIDALISDNQTAAAKASLAVGKRNGVIVDALGDLEARLADA